MPAPARAGSSRADLCGFVIKASARFAYPGAAAAARAAAQALRDAQCTFGGFHSDFYPPERMKRARLITPPSGAKINLARNDSVTPLYIACDNNHVDSDGRSCIPGSLRYGVRCDGSEINPGRVSPLLQGMEALYTAADMAED